MNDLIVQINHFILRHRLLKAQDRLIVGVSGGADSVFLLYLLKALECEWGLQIHVAHFNHALRKTAIKDERYVADLARKLRVEYSIGSWSGRKITKGSVEELARQARFDFFIKLAKDKKADCVALAHTEDDLAETVLMRILRGSGLQGLRGILPQRTIHHVKFIRPLLGTTRKEIEAYLKKERIFFCNDPTNQDRQFFRNKIRLDLLPMMERQFSRNIKSLLAGLAYNASLDYEFLEKTAEQRFRKMRRKTNRADIVQLPLSSLKKQPPALQRMIMRLAIEQLKGDTNRLTMQHIDSLEELLEEKSKSAVVHLPDGIRGYRTETAFFIQRRGK